MIDELRLRESLQRLLRDTDSAIRDRISDEPSIEAALRDRHATAVRAGRTAGSPAGYNDFLDDAVTQAAVHWLLGCVFVRFLEDNGWLDERVQTNGGRKEVAWIAGPARRLEGPSDRVARLDVSRAARTLFLRPDPLLTDRDYLLHVFGEVAKLPGMAGLFDRHHNPLFQLAPTAQGAAKIVEFFQKIDTDTGTLVHDFTDPQHGTRFLGDLYQNLSESARKRYALLQTPSFVVSFILDRTLKPAIDAFGLDTVRLIDPACGSGHFLLEAFSRLFRLWQEREPGTNPPALAQKALDAVYGVDLNPFAVEISRFRLLIAALEACGFPPCPGEVMVRNPVWSKTLDEYRDDFRSWLALSDESGTMNIAIFYDAEATAGDAKLLRAAKQDLIDLMRGERLRLARFARAIDAFPTPIGFFNNLVTSKADGEAVDLKKGGIFPIVHGVRALALEKGLTETNSAARIARLGEIGTFEPHFARELTEALHFLMTLRLDAEIAEAASTSLVRPGELTTMERDLLRDAFQVTKKLRELVRRHFNLAMF